MVIIDTCIIIDHLRQKSNQATIYYQLVKKYTKDQLAISTITIQELFTGQSTSNQTGLLTLVRLLKEIKVLHHTTLIAKRAGQITRDSQQQIKFADAAIAATVAHYGASLATLNPKDFKGIPGLKLLPL